MIIQKNFDLSALNTLQLKSVSESFVSIRSESDLKDLIESNHIKNYSVHILGGGSNLVLPTQINGLVLKTDNTGKELAGQDSDFWFVRAQAGENWHDFVQWSLQQGFFGLENLSLIPGTVGAAPIQNIGAYGVEVKDFLWQVHAIDLNTGESRFLKNQDCHFSYRDSVFKQAGSKNLLVWDVTFRLPKKYQLHIEYGDIQKELQRQQAIISPLTVSRAVINIRQNKLPDYKIIGNAGSFFKNPIVDKKIRDEILAKNPDLVSYHHKDNLYKLAAGWLIDRAGWKGRRLGPCGMYEKQALVLVNHGGANANDVWSLADAVRSDVQKLFGVDLEAEPVGW